MLTRGSSYIVLPRWIASKKAVVNPINEGDERCFMWAVIAGLHYREIGNNPERISKLKPYVGRYNWDGLVFPATLRDICRFEKKQRGYCSQRFICYREKYQHTKEI